VAAEAVPADSLHQVGLLETLRLAELVDCRPPQTVIIGVQPVATALGIGLSPEVAGSVKKAADLVMKELGSLQ
jgi:hydrogenase maturation protease